LGNQEGGELLGTCFNDPFDPLQSASSPQLISQAEIDRLFDDKRGLVVTIRDQFYALLICKCRQRLANKASRTRLNFP
jgi:hypothetical protein